MTDKLQEIKDRWSWVTLLDVCVLIIFLPFVLVAYSVERLVCRLRGHRGSNFCSRCFKDYIE